MPNRLPSVSVKDVNQQQFTRAFANFLKKYINLGVVHLYFPSYVSILAFIHYAVYITNVSGLSNTLDSIKGLCYQECTDTTTLQIIKQYNTPPPHCSTSYLLWCAALGNRPTNTVNKPTPYGEATSPDCSVNNRCTRSSLPRDAIPRKTLHCSSSAGPNCIIPATKTLSRHFQETNGFKLPKNRPQEKLRQNNTQTASFKELAPFDDDWFYTRVAALARHIYMRIVSSRWRCVFKNLGGRVNRGSAPSHYVRSSGSIARKALQTLESLKLVEKGPNGGRRLTSQGHRDLDRIASQIRIRVKSTKFTKPKPKVVVKKPKGKTGGKSE
ncbi:uncharacterized protein LOC119577692 [Penaeus monodon]|uniref:uncharacterized protein LOC119577692 n=1 Tax=Penaeus monodon TaxID=6687 RepID=UPI0018A75113|nr:uncharacterized protein LOC119577692 [Penaeus monodon]